jgi:hypothetical protein
MGILMMIIIERGRRRNSNLAGLRARLLRSN